MEDLESPPKDAVNVFNPQGELVSIPQSSLEDATSSFGGYKVATPEEIKKYDFEQKYGSASQQALAGAEGFAEGILPGISTAAEVSTGLTTPEDILARREAHPFTHGLGQAVGFGASSMIPGLGVANVAEHAGASAVAALGAKSAIASGAVRESLNMMAFQAGDEVTKMVLNDPKQSVETAVADIGISGLLGGAFGAVTGGVSALLKPTLSKIENIGPEFQARAAERAAGVDPVASTSEAMDSMYGEVKNPHSINWGQVKDEAIKKFIPEMNEKIYQNVGSTLDKIKEEIPKISNANFRNSVERMVIELESKMFPEISGAETLMGETSIRDSFSIFKELDDIKSKLQTVFKSAGRVGDYESQAVVKDISRVVRLSLEDGETWGVAGDVQKVLNEAFAKSRNPLKGFEKAFTKDIGGERVVDRALLESHISKLGTNKAFTKDIILKNFMEARKYLTDAVREAHEMLGVEAPIKTIDDAILEKLANEKPTLGARLYDYLHDKGADAAVSRGAGALAGEVIGGSFGHPILGGLFGAAKLAPFFKSALPAVGTALMENGVTAKAFKASADFVLSVAKGEHVLNKASKALFMGGMSDISQTVAPSQKDRDKLQKTMDKLMDNPDALMRMADNSPQGFPVHSGVAAQTAMNALQVIQSNKPKQEKQSPLDSMPKESAIEKAAHNRIMDLAIKPMTIMNDIQNGTITAKDVVVFEQMWPALYKNISAKMMTEMTNHIAKGEMVSYKTRLGMSVFLGQPLDSTMTPFAIQATQFKVSRQIPQQMGKPSQSSTKSLNKYAESYATPHQNREMYRSTK